MIGKLRGIVEEIYENHIILDVNGVGYVVYCNENIINKVNKDDNLSLFIEMQITDMAINMFGFESKYENAIFTCLLSVQGVGGKVAMTIIGKYIVNEIVEIIVNKDVKRMQLINGIGPKLALRIVNELSNHKTILSSWQNISSKNNLSFMNKDLSYIPDDASQIKENHFHIFDSHILDATKALINLGFHKHLVSTTIDQIITELKKNQKNANEEELVKMALMHLGRQS